MNSSSQRERELVNKKIQQQKRRREFGQLLLSIKNGSSLLYFYPIFDFLIQQTRATLIINHVVFDLRFLQIQSNRQVKMVN